MTVKMDYHVHELFTKILSVEREDAQDILSL